MINTDVDPIANRPWAEGVERNRQVPHDGTARQPATSTLNPRNPAQVESDTTLADRKAAGAAAEAQRKAAVAELLADAQRQIDALK